MGPGGADAHQSACDQEEVETEAEGDVDEQHAHEAKGDVDDVSRGEFADDFGDEEQPDASQANLKEALAAGLGGGISSGPTIQAGVPRYQCRSKLTKHVRAFWREAFFRELLRSRRYGR